MSYTPSLGLQVVNTVQYIEEAIYGTLPASPSMNWIGVDMKYEDNAENKQILIRNLGSEDLRYVVSGAQDYEVDLDYALQTSTFLKYLVNSQGGGSGSIDKSLSLVIEPKVNASNEFIQALGCRPDSGSIKWQLGKEIRVSMKLFAQLIAAYASSITGIGWASDPGTNPWVFTDPGASGITIGGTAYDINDLTVNVSRNLSKQRFLGQATVRYLPPTVRDISGDVTIMLETTANYSALLNNTSQTMVLPLKNGTSTLTLSNTYFKKQSKSIQVTKDVIFEKYSFVCESATLT